MTPDKTLPAEEAPSEASTGAIVVRYAEIGLKGRNRGFFEQALVRNAKGALRRFRGAKVRRSWGRVLVFPGDETQALQIVERLRDVFGVASISSAIAVEKEMAAIEEAAPRVLAEAVARVPGEGTIPFRVEADRADKRFPLSSMDINKRLGAFVLPKFPRLKVNLTRPEVTLGVEVRDEACYLYADRVAGPGGLPVGVSGRVLCLISGGIDSAVSAWLAMKRGCEVVFLTFHSRPFVGEASKEKVIDLVRHLARFQGRSRLHVAPFAAIQSEIRKAAPEPYRTVLYRRSMQRIAAKVAANEGALAIVTGESIGQVASQTLENIACIEDAADLSVIRPLATYDKVETIALAQRIGTFETSIRPAPDCCTVFQPEHPALRANPDVCRDVEATYDCVRLEEEAFERREIYVLAWGRPDPVRAIVPEPASPPPDAAAVSESRTEPA